MAKTSKDKDEIQLAKLTKSLLAMPRKQRDESTGAKSKKKQLKRRTA